VSSATRKADTVIFSALTRRARQLWEHRLRSHDGGESVLTDELEKPATYTGRLETLLATEVVGPPSTSPSTTVAALATLVAGRRRQNKQRQSRKHVTIRSIDWLTMFSNLCTHALTLLTNCSFGHKCPNLLA
jgi:hypothetical protein